MRRAHGLTRRALDAKIALVTGSTRKDGSQMQIIQLRPAQRRHHHTNRRRCRFAPSSLHVYRRALVRRFGLPEGKRPAAVLDTLARALLRARVA